MSIMYLIEVEHFTREKKRAYRGKIVLPQMRNLEGGLDNKIEEGLLNIMDLFFTVRKDLPTFKGRGVIVIQEEPQVFIDVDCEKDKEKDAKEFMGVLTALVYTVHNIIVSTVSEVYKEMYGKKEKTDA